MIYIYTVGGNIMTQVITQVALFRRGVKKFEQDVNDMLNAGYTISQISVEKQGFRIICLAVLVLDDK